MENKRKHTLDSVFSQQYVRENSCGHCEWVRMTWAESNASLAEDNSSLNACSIFVVETLVVALHLMQRTGVEHQLWCLNGSRPGVC